VSKAVPFAGDRQVVTGSSHGAGPISSTEVRYCTGYLGDIGVPAVDAPMDFAGWFEAYLGGRWYTFDARNNTLRIGRVLIARGRDTADVAISTTFGPTMLESFRVWTEEVPSGGASA
jgi:transglutaminase-like putative cysteine protease